MKKLLYLSGAPRVSTRDDAEAAGPRAHVLGTIQGFKENGFTVDEYIVGDLNPPQWSKNGTEKRMVNAVYIRLAADLVRIISSIINNFRSVKKYSDKTVVVYERFGAFQNLGRKFQKKGILWILESNSPLFYEASTERKSIFFTNLCRKWEIKAYKECDYLVCVTTQLKDIIVDQIGIDPKKIIVLPNGVDTVRFNPSKAKSIRFSNKFTIGFVGILAPWCGVEVLIKAILILKQKGILISATIVGDGMMQKEFKDLAKGFNLDEEINFVGRVNWSSIPSYIAGFDLAYSGQINLQIGKMYHSPLKIYEYMSMGKAVIASSFEDAKKMIENERNGFLFEPGNEFRLAEVLEKAYQNYDSLKSNAESIRQDVIDNHSWTHRVAELIEQVEFSGNEG